MNSQVQHFSDMILGIFILMTHNTNNETYLQNLQNIFIYKQTNLFQLQPGNAGEWISDSTPVVMEERRYQDIINVKNTEHRFTGSKIMYSSLVK